MSQAAYRINGQLVERAAFYAVACDPARSVAVEACAGAGKTWMLVSRILRALLDGSAPQDILAITFTKKGRGRNAPAPAGLAALVRPEDRRRTGDRVGVARHDARRSAGKGRRSARAARPPAGRRPPGADPHLPQLVRVAAAQRAAGGAAGAGPACRSRAAGRRQRSRRTDLAALLRGGGSRRNPPAGLHGQRGAPRPSPDPQGPGQRAEQAGGVRAGRRAGHGGRVGARRCRWSVSRTSPHTTTPRMRCWPTAGPCCWPPPPAWAGQRAHLFGQGRGAGNRRHRVEWPEDAITALAHTEERAAQVQRQARRH